MLDLQFVHRPQFDGEGLLASQHHPGQPGDAEPSGEVDEPGLVGGVFANRRGDEQPDADREHGCVYRPVSRCSAHPDHHQHHREHAALVAVDDDDDRSATEGDGREDRHRHPQPAGDQRPRHQTDQGGADGHRGERVVAAEDGDERGGDSGERQHESRRHCMAGLGVGVAGYGSAGHVTTIRGRGGLGHGPGVGARPVPWSGGSAARAVHEPGTERIAVRCAGGPLTRTMWGWPAIGVGPMEEVWKCSLDWECSRCAGGDWCCR